MILWLIRIHRGQVMSEDRYLRHQGHAPTNNGPNHVRRLLIVLHRRKSRDHTRSLDVVGPFIVASYLQSIVNTSVNEKFRPDLKAMALLALGLCDPKSLFSRKLERPKAEQEVLRRLIEDCKNSKHKM